MRQIGTIPEERDARRLADYLLTLDITTRVDPTKDGWAVWVHHEDQVARASGEFGAFLADRDDPKYGAAAEAARVRRKVLRKQERAHARNSINLGAGQNYRPVLRCPVTFALIGISVAVSILSHFGSYRQPLTRLVVLAQVPFSPRIIVDDEGRPQYISDPDPDEIIPLAEVRQGQVWRLVTPIFLHLSIIHLLFNMSWVYELGGMIEMRRGSWKLAAMVLAIALASNLGQYYTSLANGPAAGIFGGMSGVVYGLFGYVWMKDHYEPSLGMSPRQGTATIMILWLFFCMTGLIGPIANAAHVIGLLAGGLIGFVPHAGQEVRRWI